jgi:hypothetical protein
MSITHLSQILVFGVDKGERNVSGIRLFEKSARRARSGKNRKRNSASRRNRNLFLKTRPSGFCFFYLRAFDPE